MLYPAAIFCLAMLGLSACKGTGGSADRHGSADTIALAACPTFSADSAMKYIQGQCDFGPRVTGTPQSRACAEYIAALFRLYGAKVETQKCAVRIWDGTQLEATNIIASINPDNTDRILLCAHWDSRPWADNDPDAANHHKPILGANDGASGVAVMIELCRLLSMQGVDTGIDFVCFDAEDLGTPQWAEGMDDTSQTWCLGSYHWAAKACETGYKARFGILLDMVGGFGSVFHREVVSMNYAEPVVNLVWRLGRQLGYSHHFPLSDGGMLIDDHVNVNRIARIPCIDIVPHFNEGPSSFGPTWHTIGDTPENIDPNVLEAVGQTLTQLIYNDNEKI